MKIVFIITIFTLSCVAGTSVITPKLNPGCEECETLLYYITVLNQDNNYLIHQLWDFSGHVPTILYIIGNRTSTLSIEWVDKKPDQIRTHGCYHSFGMSLESLIEYNDTNDERAYFDYNYPHREISLRGITWEPIENPRPRLTVQLRAAGKLSWDLHRMNGSIDMTFTMVLLPLKDRKPPRLFHTLNITEASVTLEGLTGSPNYTAGRFALRYVLVSQGNAGDLLQYNIERTIDDEFIPGVFELITLTPPGGAQDLGGYIQYRPVAYTEEGRSGESSITATVRDYNKTKLPDCLAGKYFAKFLPENVFTSELIATCGQTGDGYYKKTNFTVWSYSIGYGVPPSDPISQFAVIGLAVILAAPLLILSYMCCRIRRLYREEEERLLVDSDS